jgi:chemotaxis protein CheX
LEINTYRDRAVVFPEIRDQVLEPFISGTRLALSEMAGVEIVVQDVYKQPLDKTLHEISALLALTSPTEKEGCLILSFPGQTARAIADRMLAAAEGEPPAPDIVSDCMGEIANVVAGQAKALLAGSPYHFTFSTPTVISGAGQDIQPLHGQDCLIVAFMCEAGPFGMQLVLNK